jgi:protein subunit release factor B
MLHNWFCSIVKINRNFIKIPVEKVQIKQYASHSGKGGQKINRKIIFLVMF